VRWVRGGRINREICVIHIHIYPICVLILFFLSARAVTYWGLILIIIKN